MRLLALSGQRSAAWRSTRPVVTCFDKNWAKYLQYWGEAGTGLLEEHAISFMQDYYKNTILPKVIK
jgi:hypothetical protein